ncbi:GNAT family N-acetyltransferase [Streptomyces sp. 7-21]|uniref:GNAT family N-acetyltransferase n=1 Tax=Streptomyces sp. 7-21 TaxID=2802283 RepID=UPI00191EC8E1|nr:GNAT family N-acetyltransferase [Streptomyces sp. 7-21]MBL1069023.1 N-acetyltransferase [Streptomyces sp. 7-21]
MTPDIIDAEGRGRFEARDGERITGYLVYRRDEGTDDGTGGERRRGTVDYLSTFVPEESRGQGVAAELARAALEDARHRGLRVRPTCPFVAGYVERHPEYRPLLAG